MTIIYILELEYGKYYVGKTDDVDKRYQQHLNGQGSYFTKKYKPVRILRIVPDANDFDEDRYVKEMMADHGIDNVRGGSYSNNLTYDQIAMLRRDANGVALDDFNTTNNDDMDLKTAIEALVVKKASECTIC
jgi:hypothetical protein